MQATSDAYKLAYERAHSLYAQPRVIADWNHNRFAEVVTASNNGSPGVADDPTPIASIAYTLRGTTGLAKARVGEARTYDSRLDNGVQYRTVGPESSYKYYSTTHQTDAAGNIANVGPQVVYGNDRMTNKIVVGLETSWSYPDVWDLYVTTVANPTNTDWTKILDQNSGTINAAGRIVAYLQPGGTTWGTTVYRGTPTPIRGVKFIPRHLVLTNPGKPDNNRQHRNGPSYSSPPKAMHFNMIELSARMERELTEDIVTLSTSRNVSEASPIFPTGQITANTATVTLDNSHEKYDKDNTASEYYGLIDDNVEIYIELGTDVSQYGGGMEYVPQGVYYVDSWSLEPQESVVSLECTDFAKFLQAQNVLPVLFIDRTPGQIIAELLSSVGVRNYAIDTSNDEKQASIPYVWFNEEQTVWAAIQSICAATQGTVYTDERGILRYVSRDRAFQNAQGTPDARLTASDEGARLANIETLSLNYETEANKVRVNYKPYVANSRKTPVDTQVELDLPFRRTRRINRREYDTVPIDSVLWKPEDTVLLRGDELVDSMTADQKHFRIPQDGAMGWPWSGHVNIEGEILSWEGKQYLYWKNGREVRVNVTSAEQQKQIDDMESDLSTRHKNHYTGYMFGVKRGLMNTKAAPHTIDLAGWSAWLKRGDNTVVSAPKRMTRIPSCMVLNGASVDDYGTYLLAMRGSFNDRYRVYGTRLRFANAQYSAGTMGMFFQMQSDRKQGYYVEINLSDYATKVQKGNISEVRVYRMMADGNRRALPHPTKNARGFGLPVVKNQWIDIEVTHAWETNTYAVYINGQLFTTFQDPDGTLPPGNWGTFVRGHTIGVFEYFYVVNTVDGTIPNIEDSSFQNKVNGGFTSGFQDREISRRNSKYVNWYFDDFGPWVHEMRKFEVEFDKAPALDAHVFMSNDWDAFIIEANRTPFAASFWIANGGRGGAVLNGEDDTIFIGGSPAKQQLILYGQLIIEDSENQTVSQKDSEEDENSVTVENEFSIRKRGVVDLTYESDWIQSKTQAEELGKWVTAHWGESVDTLSVSGYFPPSLQLGDLVEINYPDRNMLPENHRYHVIGLNVGYETGIQTSLELRRVR